MEAKSSKKGVIAAVIILAVVVAAMAVIYMFMKPGTQSGSKTVTIQVIDSAGETASYTVRTDAQYLDQAMDEAQGLSYETDEGGMVITVNGETADYTADPTGLFMLMENIAAMALPSSR